MRKGAAKLQLLFPVGKTGFEPATPWSQTRCATGLRYFPISFQPPVGWDPPRRCELRGCKGRDPDDCFQQIAKILFDGTDFHQDILVIAVAGAKVNPARRTHTNIP